MSGPATGSIAGAAGLATAISFLPVGVSPATFSWGAGAFLLGIAARAGGILFKKLDGNQAVGFSDFIRPFAAILVMIPVALAAACIAFLTAALSHVNADGGIDGGLLLLGLRGLEGFTWLSNRAADIFFRFAPGQKPGTGGP